MYRGRERERERERERDIYIYTYIHTYKGRRAPGRRHVGLLPGLRRGAYTEEGGIRTAIRPVRLLRVGISEGLTQADS